MTKAQLLQLPLIQRHSTEENNGKIGRNVKTSALFQKIHSAKNTFYFIEVLVGNKLNYILILIFIEVCLLRTRSRSRFKFSWSMLKFLKVFHPFFLHITIKAIAYTVLLLLQWWMNNLRDIDGNTFFLIISNRNNYYNILYFKRSFMLC